MHLTRQYKSLHFSSFNISIRTFHTDSYRTKARKGSYFPGPLKYLVIEMQLTTRFGAGKNIDLKSGCQRVFPTMFWKLCKDVFNVNREERHVYVTNKMIYSLILNHCSWWTLRCLYCFFSKMLDCCIMYIQYGK